jgi:hypothetical protein
MNTIAIPAERLHVVWHELAPLLERAVKRSADKPDLVAHLLAGEAQLWAIYDGDQPVAAIVTRIQQTHDERRCLLWLVGGGRVGEWAVESLTELETWARSLGCVALWGCGRRGWARVVGKFGGTSIGLFNGEPAWERRIS